MNQGLRYLCNSAISKVKTIFSSEQSPLTPYVAGFFFSRTRDRVLLIVKAKPEWQRGRLNAVGGKVFVEDGLISEQPVDAMEREFKEETGLHVARDRWSLFCNYSHPSRGGFVSFYRAVATSEGEFLSAYTAEVDSGEQVVAVAVDEVLKMGHDRVISNLRWLIPAALHVGDGDVILIQDSH